MSVILSNASPLKAEIRLAQAVSQFEAELSSDQKAMFRSYKAQSLASAPTPDDVITVTALIDRSASGKVGGRCFGTRFYNVLQAVQQFAALGDIIIGGSQNMIACGVWSLVRMSLLMIVTSASYLEKISGLFMTVGRSAPRYQMMASLYPRSKTLQSSLSEYFIVVVGLCHRLLKFTQKSTLGQIVSSLNDSDIKTTETQLVTWANSIKEEVVLLSSKKIEEEAQENSRFRAVTNRFSENASYRKKLERNRHVLDTCSTYDHETTWKQIRKLGNATVLDKNEKYRDWKNGEKSSTLVCMGKLGSGKSVLLANTVDDLHLQDRDRKVPVAYFFCRYDIPESLIARTIVGSFARQLLRSFPDLSVAESILDESSPGFDIENVCTLLQRIVPSNFKALFVLDGLDECPPRERQDLIDQLLRLQMKFTLLLYISYRLDVDNSSKLHPLIDATVIEIPDENPDIQEYIVAELRNCLESGMLSIGNPELILEIRDALIEGAKGMFLWVSLQLKSLCAEKTDEDIRRSLANLPRNLPETFSRILELSRGPADSSYQHRILKLVTVSQRPLKTEELREALSVVPGDTTWNPARLINDIDSTLACCGSLLLIDEEELTVRIIHHSAKQYLLNGQNTSAGIPFSFKNAQIFMAEIVLTYLNYGIFETQLSTVVAPRLDTASAPSQILRSSLTSSSIARSIALQLLLSRKQPNHNIGKVVADARNRSKTESTDEHPFYTYANSFWFYHTWAISSDNSGIYNLLLNLREKALVSSLPEYFDDPLPWAARYGYENVVQELLADRRLLESQLARGYQDQRPFWIAIKSKHEDIAQLLLEAGMVNLNSMNLVDGDGQTPLTAIATLGNEALVKLIIEYGHFDPVDSSFDASSSQGHITRPFELFEVLDINATNEYGRTALSCAATRGHDSIVKILLETGECNTRLKDTNGDTAYELAQMMGFTGICDMLDPYIVEERMHKNRRRQAAKQKQPGRNAEEETVY